MAARQATWDAVALLDELIEPAAHRAVVEGDPLDALFGPARGPRQRQRQSGPGRSDYGARVLPPPSTPFPWTRGAGPDPRSWEGRQWAEMLRPLVGWSCRTLPPSHYVADLADNPAGPLLYPSAAVPAYGQERDVSPMPPRFHRAAVVDLDKPIPASPAGTHALVVGVVVADMTADDLDAAAVDEGVATANKYRAESAAYRDYATAANARVSGSVASWRPAVADLLTRPTSPPQYVGATPYGYASAAPSDRSRDARGRRI